MWRLRGWLIYVTWQQGVVDWWELVSALVTIKGRWPSPDLNGFSQTILLSLSKILISLWSLCIHQDVNLQVMTLSCVYWVSFLVSAHFLRCIWSHLLTCQLVNKPTSVLSGFFVLGVESMLRMVLVGLECAVIPAARSLAFIIFVYNICLL